MSHNLCMMGFGIYKTRNLFSIPELRIEGMKKYRYMYCELLYIFGCYSI